MTNKKKLVLIFPFNLLAHYLRCLVLADTYDKDLYDVRFLDSAQYNSFVKAHGYECFSCATLDANFVMDCTNNFNFDWMNEADLQKVLLSQVKCIQELKPDIIIGDVAPTLKMAAELTGVEHINIVNGYMTRFYARTRKIPRKHKAFPYVQQLPTKFADAITSFGEQLTFRKIQASFNNLRKRYGLPCLKDYLEELEAPENLICDMPELFPQKMLPSAYRFIGPLIYRNYTDSGDWEQLVDWEKPLICVCMGSSGDWEQLKFLNDPYYSKYNILTAGDKAGVLSADHVIARSFVNLDRALSRSSLMICHGGNGTIYLGITNGVFMLCLSSHFEQDYNIDAIARHGYGKSGVDFSEEMWRLEIDLHCEKYKIRQPA